MSSEMREKKNLPSDDFVSRDCLTRLSSLFSNDIKLFCLRSDSGDMLAYSLWYQQKYAYYLEVQSQQVILTITVLDIILWIRY